MVVAITKTRPKERLPWEGDTRTKMFAKLKLDEGSKFRAHMDEVVRGSVEKTLNVILIRPEYV